MIIAQHSASWAHPLRAIHSQVTSLACGISTLPSPMTVAAPGPLPMQRLPIRCSAAAYGTRVAAIRAATCSTLTTLLRTSSGACWWVTLTAAPELARALFSGDHRLLVAALTQDFTPPRAKTARASGDPD